MQIVVIDRHNAALIQGYLSEKKIKFTMNYQLTFLPYIEGDNINKEGLTSVFVFYTNKLTKKQIQEINDLEGEV